ncbi:MAG: pyrrolo-quinoline quinone, partial [Bacillota bacterium]
MKRCSVIFAVILLLCGCSRNLKNSISPVSYTSADNFIEKRIERKIEKRIFDFVAEGSEPIQEDIIVPGKFDLSGISHELRATIKGIVNKKQTFPEKYTDMEGILTFRGNNLRDSAAYGKVYIKEKKLEVLWAFETSSRSWGGGAGWTGQAAIIKWPAEAIELMNIKKEFKSRKDLTEAVCPSLDGRIYFLELESGLQTRQHIDIKNPIKGSITLDPRGFPLLYVGQGLQETDVMGFRIFSLIDGKLLHFINGKDSFALRKWCAFDGSPLINRNTDTMILGGENGLLYNIKLNTEFDKVNKTIKLEPEEVKYRYKIKGNSFQGIENSVAAYKNLVYFADNGGSIQAVDLINMETVWVLDKIDDTDATITVEVEEGVPYLYTGTEVDKQGIMGNSHIRKINGLTGEVLWDKQYHCISLQGEK